MTLLDRYLQTVRAFLPKAQAPDIIRELSENIRSRMDDREEELGRPLTEDEQAAILKQHGPPMLVASSYGTRRYLIGPALFPIYWRVLKAALLAALAINLLISVASALLTGDVSRILVTLLRLPVIAFTIFACITLIFFLLEQAESRYKFTDRWDPRSLPIADPPSHPSRSRSLPGFVFHALVTVSALYIFRFGPLTALLTFGPAAAIFAFAPVWLTIYPALVLISLGFLTVEGLTLFRPDWSKLLSTARVLLDAAGLALVAFLLHAGYWIALVNSARTSLQYQPVLDIANKSVYFSLIVIGAVILFDAARQFPRIFRRTSTQALSFIS